MSPAVRDIFRDWQLPIPLTLSILITAVLYIRGWLALQRTRRAQFNDLRLASFLLGLVILWLAIGSPMDGFADALLSAHMVEHLLLMSVVPPLVLFGLPVVKLLRGLPDILRRRIAAPLIRRPWLRRFSHWLITPRVAWIAMNLAFLGWHIPAAYDFALEHENWHDVEHLCFLFGSILFWWCILRPWPTQQRLHSFRIILYLVSADLVNTIVSASLAFADRPVYQYYVRNPNPFGVSLLQDQILGAAIMWVIGSLIFLGPVMAITYNMLSPSREPAQS